MISLNIYIGIIVNKYKIFAATIKHSYFINIHIWGLQHCYLVAYEQIKLLVVLVFLLTLHVSSCSHVSSWCNSATEGSKWLQYQVLKWCLSNGTTLKSKFMKLELNYHSLSLINYH